MRSRGELHEQAGVRRARRPYYDVGDLDTALDWAARCRAAASGAVEVRPNLSI
jgi:hypothetical protein